MSGEEVLSFNDYHEGDIVNYQGEEYVVTKISVDPTDPNGTLGYAGLSSLDNNGKYSNEPSLYIDAPTQAKRVGNVEEPELISLSNTTATNQNVDEFESINQNATTITNQEINQPAETERPTQAIPKEQSLTSGYAKKDYSAMKFGTITEILNQWNLMITAFDGAWLRASENNGYKTVLDAGLDNGFIEAYDKNIINLVEVLKFSANTLKSTLEDLLGSDIAIENEIPGNGNDNGNGGSGNTEQPTEPTPDALVDNSKEQLEAYKNLSMNDLSNIAAELNKLSSTEEKSIEELLNNEEYSEQIQNMLLASPNIHDDLKQLITDGSSVITQAVLKSIFNGQQGDIIGLNDNTILTLKNYLGSIAQSNNLSLESLILEENNSQVLKTALKGFSSVTTTLKELDDTQLKDKLIQIYDGDGIGDMEESTISIIRDHADSIAQNTSSNVEDMFQSDFVPSELKGLGKFSVFLDSLSGYSNQSIKSILTSLMTANNR